MSNPLRGVSRLGQSVWYDNISRDILRSGELKRMIDEDGISGLTSNPTIFEKAIGGSKIYDHDIHVLVDRGKSIHEIYEGLAVTDIREAADLLMPVYERTSGVDGYVSLEVSPRLACKAAETVEQARRLFSLVDRKNLMIKVPATPQGFIAVADLLASGINVNVTLIFSLDQYRKAAEAYIDGVSRWLSSGGDPAQPASVASFFVSRIDTLIDERLDEMAGPSVRTPLSELKGKAATACSKIAYSIYKEIFRGETFAGLRARGVRPQRLLWASTSTKNPQYPDTYYVDALLGPETVNTLPQVTVAAYRDHGNPVARLEDGLEEAQAVLRALEEAGINISAVMAQLLEKGVDAFAYSFDKLLEGIATKRTRLLRGWGHRSASLAGLQKPVDEALDKLDREKISEKIWAYDASVWKDDPAQIKEIGQRLGWLRAVDTMRGEVDKLRAFADEIRSLGFTTAVLLGMGGSSLASEVFATCFGIAEGYLDLKVLDTTVPASILDVERGLDLTRTLFIVSSKSGGTIEVVSLYKHFRDRVEKAVGEKAGEHFIAITDPGTSLGRLAANERFRKVFLNPPDIGGRFSALSYFGLVPASLIGADVGRILLRASQAVESAGPDVPALENAGLWLGVIMAQASLLGMDKLCLIMSPPLSSFGCWVEQLIAESTGKEGKGIIPVHGESVGDPDKYGKDRVFVYLRVDGDQTYDEFVSSLEQAGHPVVTLRLHGPYDIGREIFRWEFATAVAGAILGINPFDQPNVQEAKDLTKHVIDLFRAEGNILEGERAEIDDPALPSRLADFLSQTSAGDYIAVNAFLRPSPESVGTLTAMRTALRDRFKVATALGWGPRFLHSTGQIHKGGPDKGLFIQITAEDIEDTDIPGEFYSFGVLKSAQALGDYEALKRRGRRIIRIHLASESDLEKLLRMVSAL